MPYLAIVATSHSWFPRPLQPQALSALRCSWGVFLREVGPALHTVTSLALNLQDTGSSAVIAALLCEALALLAGACPALTSLTVEGSSRLETLCKLGQACRLLTALTVVAEDEDMPEVQQLVSLLPSLLPNVHTLSLPDLVSALPNMPHRSPGVGTAAPSNSPSAHDRGSEV